MPLHTGESPASGDSSDDFEEYRIHRSGERVIAHELGEIAAIDDSLDDLLEGVA
jgi:hypothetical protein